MKLDIHFILFFMLSILIMAFTLRNAHLAGMPKKYVLNNGETVECKQASSNCGIDLFDCLDGNKYLCQTNVKAIK